MFFLIDIAATGVYTKHTEIGTPRKR